MGTTRTRVLRKLAHTSAAVALGGCAALGVAAPALADQGANIFVGGNQCGLTPPTSCQPSQANWTQPPEANQTQVSFTPNPNPCPDLSAKVDEGGNPIPLNTQIPMAPGPHTFNITATCSQPLASWGGQVHIDYIKVTGQPAGAPPAPAPVAPKDAIVVDVEQSPTSVSVNVRNTSDLAGKCTYDANPTNGLLMPPVHRNFDVNANDSTKLDFLAPPPGITYHLVVACHGKFNGKDDEFGHFEQNVTGGL
jgi:hypothetical protein